MSSSFLQGFQGGLGSVMQLYDLKDRRQRAKKQAERDDQRWERQQKQWDLQDKQTERKLSEQQLRDALLFEDTIGSWMNGDVKELPPGFYDATSRLYSDELNQGYGKNKSLNRIVPTPDGKNWMAELNVEDEITGERYNAPLTMNRSNDKNDQVRLFSPDDIAEWYAEARRTTAHLPPEERARILGKVKEDVYRLAGDNSLYDARVKAEEEDRLYKRGRKDTKEDRAADHANAVELQGMKSAAARERALIKNNGKGGLKPGDLNRVQDDLSRMIWKPYQDSDGNLLGIKESDIPRVEMQVAAATGWEQQNPGMVDYGTTARISKKALDGLPFTPKQAIEMAPDAWERFANSDMVAQKSRNRVLTVDGRSVSRKDFMEEFVRSAPVNSEQAYMAKFNELMNAEIARRSPQQRQAQQPVDQLTQARQRRTQQEQQQPIPMYDDEDRSQIAKRQKSLEWGRSQLDQIEIPKTNAEVDTVLQQGMQALRAGAPTQGVVDALRAQGIREDLINGLVSGTTGEQYR